MKAVGSKVIIRKKTQEEKLPSGIIMPPSAKDPNVCKGEVISVADSYVDNGLLCYPQFEEGSMVGFFLKNAVKIDGEQDLYFTDISNIIYVY